MRIRQIAAAAGFVIGFCFAVGSVVADDASTTVTVYRSTGDGYGGYNYGYGYGAGYNGGYCPNGYDQYGYCIQNTTQMSNAAVVVAQRSIELSKGVSKVSFAGVPARIDSSTVQFKSLTDPAGTDVVEQRFAYDLESPEAVLRKYVDNEITVVTDRGEITGTLRSFSSTQIVLETNDPDHPVQILQRGDYVRDIKFGKLADPLVTEPTLLWKVNAKKGGTHDVELTYRAEGLNWDADYTAIFDEGKGTIDLSAWVTVTNNSGADYTDANVILVSGGQVDPYVQPYAAYSGYTPAPPEDKSTWTYPLEQVTEIKDGSNVQLELFSPIVASKANKVIVFEPLPDNSIYQTYANTDCYAYQYNASGSPMSSNVYVEVSPKKGKDMPAFPEGQVRVYRKGKDSKALELLGEDQLRIDSDAAQLRLRVGANSDITGERRQLECRPDHGQKRMRERMEVTVKNNGDTAQEVVLLEYMQRWSRYVIDAESETGTKVGRAGREYRLNIPAGKSKTVTYTVIYSW